MSCSFYKSCIAFSDETCHASSIKEKSCGGPIFKKFIIKNLALPNYQIEIVSQCPECGYFYGVAKDGNDGVKYKSEYVRLSAAEIEKKYSGLTAEEMVKVFETTCSYCNPVRRSAGCR